jgi:hypothetical protein
MTECSKCKFYKTEWDKDPCLTCTSFTDGFSLFTPEENDKGGKEEFPELTIYRA